LVCTIYNVHIYTCTGIKLLVVEELTTADDEVIIDGVVNMTDDDILVVDDIIMVDEEVEMIGARTIP